MDAGTAEQDWRPAVQRWQAENKRLVEGGGAAWEFEWRHVSLATYQACVLQEQAVVWHHPAEDALRGG